MARAVWRQFGIHIFKRFKDDMFLVARSRADGLQFVLEYGRRSKYYRSDVEDYSTAGIHILDLHIIKHGPRYIVSPAFKGNFMDSSPLDVCSAHQPSTHLAWPKARLRAFQLLSSTPGAANNAMDMFIDRFVRHYVDGGYVQYMRQYASDICRHNRSEGQQCRIRCGRSSDVPPKKCIADQAVRRLWLVLPFHPVYVGNVRRAVGRINLMKTMQWLHGAAFSGQSFELRVSWTNCSRHLHVKLRSYNVTG